MDFEKEIMDGTVKKIHRKEILRRALFYLVEEHGILHNSHYYKGKIFEIEPNGNIKIDFGIADPKLMEQAKKIADARIGFFAQDFAEKWRHKYPGANYIPDAEVEEFLESVR